MTAEGKGGSGQKGSCYRIRINGHLNDSWSEWFNGLTIYKEPDATTVLWGPVTDQPALHGLLNRIRDLGLSLSSVTRIEDDGDDQGGQ